ncbi:STAS domain-containing protein [Actinocrispum sp. NPDC049592]|uniref:STAS domain-containing protein n=1 Tax=Actinocrispum sp. NPDC049592 TaxID=3154835 RepID=UPI00342DD859
MWTGRVRPNIVVVQVAGELDMSSVKPLETAVGHQLTTRPKGLVIDMRNVTFCRSSGLRVLLKARESAEDAHIGLRLVAVRPAVLRVLEISGLGSVFDVRESVPEAMKELVT